MRALIRPERTFREALNQGSEHPSADAPPFRGELSGRRFKIRRFVRKRNSFVPVIRGEIETDWRGGSTVRVWMTLHPFVFAFLLVWFGTLAIGMRQEMMAGGPDVRMIAAMMLYGLLLPNVGFFPEVWKARRILRRALTGEIDLAPKE